MAQARAARAIGGHPVSGRMIDMGNEGSRYVARVPHGELEDSDQRYLENFLERLELVRQAQEEQLANLKQARAVVEYGGALPGTPQWTDAWNKVRASDLQGRVLTNVLSQLDDLSKPAYFNPPEGVAGMERIPESESLGRNFTRETGIYRTAAPRSEGGRLIDYGAYSNIGSRPGPAKINTPEGEAQFEGIKAIANAISGKTEGKIDRFRQTPEQEFITDQYKALSQEYKGLNEINDPDGTRRGEIKIEMKDLVDRHKAEAARLGPNAGGFPAQEQSPWPGEEKPETGRKEYNTESEPWEQSLEGRTATNKKTGEKIVFKGGKWVPMNPGGGTPAQPTAAAEELPFEVQQKDGAVMVKGPNDTTFRKPTREEIVLIQKHYAPKAYKGRLSEDIGRLLSGLGRPQENWQPMR